MSKVDNWKELQTYAVQKYKTRINKKEKNEKKINYNKSKRNIL